MTRNPSPYTPISCEFHDQLESLATLRKPAPISFRDEEGVLQQRNDTITDVYSLGGEEFISLGTGEILRLDQLVEVDGVRLADYCATDAGDD